MTDLDLCIEVLKDKEFVFDISDIRINMIIYKYYSEDLEEYAYVYITYNKEEKYIVNMNLFQRSEIFDKNIFIKELREEISKRKINI